MAMTNINTMIDWMQQRQGKVTYSMTARLGPNSYDCSSAVYNALIAGGFLPNGSMGNTETLFNDLEKNGWQQVQPNNGHYPAKRGDIFIWGTRGHTLGAAGHTGIFVDNNDNIIHCNYGYNGITVNDHDTIWGYNGQPAITIYRYPGNGTTNSNNQDNTTNINTETPKIKRKGDRIMYLIEVVKKKGSNEVWFIDGGDRSWLPTGQDVKDVQYLLDSNGMNSKLTKFSEDNRTLKNLFKKKKEVKY
jgi:hypothetical protein